jgi:hypothetical protein
LCFAEADTVQQRGGVGNDAVGAGENTAAIATDDLHVT